MSNLLIVEGKGDKVFFEALIDHINITLKVGQPICNIGECKSLDGKDKLSPKLKSIKGDINKGKYKNIGIILDADNIGIKGRTEEIKKAINDHFTDDSLFMIHIMNINGTGELENLLKTIQNKQVDSTFSDCLECWSACIEKREKTFNPKDLIKLWVQVYHRYDINPDDKNLNKCINSENYDFDLDLKELTEIKNFLIALANTP